MTRPKFVKEAIIYRTQEAQYDQQANANLLRFIYRLTWFTGNNDFLLKYPFPNDREYVSNFTIQLIPKNNFHKYVSFLR